MIFIKWNMIVHLHFFFNMARQIKTALGIKIFEINDNINLNGKNKK